VSGQPMEEGIRAGDRIVIDGRPRVVLGASGTVLRFADDDGMVAEATVAELIGSGRLRLLPRTAGPNPQRCPDAGNPARRQRRRRGHYGSHPA